MSLLKALIVDDEHLARRGLSMRLDLIDGVEVVAECANGVTALEAVSVHSPDLLFLDIEMPGMNGFEVVQKLQGDTMPMVVFVTAYNEYAVEAFKVNAIDYVLKPLEEERIRDAVERARTLRDQQDAAQEKARLMSMMTAMNNDQSLNLVEPEPQESTSSERLLIREGGEVRFIPMREIEWIDAAGDYMCVHARGETHIMRTTMKQLESQLNPERFARVHRSTIVNTDFIASAQSLACGEYRLTLNSGTQLKVSRGQREALKKLMGKC